MRKMSGIRANSRTRKAYPDKLCALPGCGCYFEDRPTYKKGIIAHRKYCGPSCSAEGSRLKGGEILTGRGAR